MQRDSFDTAKRWSDFLGFFIRTTILFSLSRVVASVDPQSRDKPTAFALLGEDAWVYTFASGLLAGSGFIMLGLMANCVGEFSTLKMPQTWPKTVSRLISLIILVLVIFLLLIANSALFIILDAEMAS